MNYMYNDWVQMLVKHPPHPHNINLQEDDEEILNLFMDIRDEKFDAGSSNISPAYSQTLEACAAPTGMSAELHR